MRMRIFTTGGTIDKIYFDKKSDFQVGDPQIVGLLEAANIAFAFEVVPLMQKDSLDMDDADRARIARAVRQDSHRHILVTHGTDTMIATAKALGRIQDKTVVFTGAMQPSRFRTTDAEFNVGFAAAAVQLLPSGVYIAMNGQVFDPQNARKNVSFNRFESLTP